MPERSVLIIDDDEALIRMLRTAFQRYKFDVVLAKDGTEGLALAHQRAPDLIILSVELPKGNGFLVCKDFKQAAELKEIPVILTSRKASDADFEKHRKLKIRANDYLHKPFTDEELFQKVGNVIGFSLSPDEYTQLEAKVHDFLEERTKLETEINDKTDRIVDLETELAETRKEGRRLQKQITQLEETAANQSNSAAGLKEAESELKRAQKQLGDAEAQLVTMRDEQKVAERKIRELEPLRTSVAELKETIAVKERLLKEATLRTQELEGVRDGLEAQIAESARALATSEAQLKSKTESLKAHEKVEAQLSDAVKARTKVEADLAGLRDIVAEVEGLVGISLDELREKAPQWRREAEKLPVAEKEAAGLRTELQDLEKALEKETKKRGKLREVLERAIATLD
jgi:DNA-binding response OmpR family regulator